MKKLTLKAKILLGLLVVLLAIQLVPSKVNNGEAKDPEFYNAYPTSNTVKQILRTSCADCHSNHTNYPWYASIQPVGLWIDHHVEEGKEHFNMDAWNTYSQKQKMHKLEELREEVNGGEMPLKSYLMIHSNAELTATQVREINLWIGGILPPESQGSENQATEKD